MNLQDLKKKTPPELLAFAEEQGAGWRRFDLSPDEIFNWLSPAFAGGSLRTGPARSWAVERTGFRVRAARLPNAGAGHRSSCRYLALI